MEIYLRERSGPLKTVYWISSARAKMSHVSVTLEIVMLKLPVKRHGCIPFCTLCSLTVQCFPRGKHMMFRESTQA